MQGSIYHKICRLVDPRKYDGLCSECGNNVHQISKHFRDHGVISLENYHQLPSYISEIGNHCEYHDMKYTDFFQNIMTNLAVQIVLLQTSKTVLGFSIFVK